MNAKVIKAELTFSTSRSSGKGGQHVNKTESKVEAVFDLNASFGLSDEEKEILLKKYASRIKSGKIRIFVQIHRSQIKNRELAVKKMLSLLERGVRTPKKRIATATPKVVKEKRLADKKRRHEIKETRKKII